MRKIIFVLIAALFFNSDAEADLKTEQYFRVMLAKPSPETILITSSSLDGEKAHFISYTFDGRLVKKILIEKSQYEEFISSFEKALPETRQKRLGATITSCGQPVEIKFRKSPDGAPVDRRLCLDGASKAEQSSVGKWWLQVRSTLRL